MITVVSGLGRCGTSMMMQMLAAGGVHCVGEHPAYEDPMASRIPLDDWWLDRCSGRAVKILDPHRGWRGMHGARFIWMDRDVKQQAKSQRKFLLALMGVNAKAGALAAGLRADRAKCMRLLVPYDRIMFSFEDIISNPLASASRLTTYFPNIDIESAASVVHRRSTDCAPDMTLEASLLPA